MIRIGDELIKAALAALLIYAAASTTRADPQEVKRLLAMLGSTGGSRSYAEPADEGQQRDEQIFRERGIAFGKAKEGSADYSGAHEASKHDDSAMHHLRGLYCCALRGLRRLNPFADSWR